MTFELCDGGVTQRFRHCALLAWEMFLWSWPWPWPWPWPCSGPAPSSISCLGPGFGIQVLRVNLSDLPLHPRPLVTRRLHRTLATLVTRNKFAARKKETSCPLRP